MGSASAADNMAAKHNSRVIGESFMGLLFLIFERMGNWRGEERFLRQKRRVRRGWLARPPWRGREPAESRLQPGLAAPQSTIELRPRRPFQLSAADRRPYR